MCRICEQVGLIQALQIKFHKWMEDQEAVEPSDVLEDVLQQLPQELEDDWSIPRPKEGTEEERAKWSAMASDAGGMRINPDECNAFRMGSRCSMLPPSAAPLALPPAPTPSPQPQETRNLLMTPPAYSS